MSASADLLRTPLYDWHEANGARIVDFAGWAMPVQYTSIVAEHNATRSAVGLFDVSHMGRIRFHGPDAARFLDSVLTRRVTDLKPWRARYSFICNEDGGVLDDVLIYRLWPDSEAEKDRPPWQLVVNASNRQKILQWLRAHRGNFDVSFEDVTEATAMIAVQGPRALEMLAPDCDVAIRDMKYFHAALCCVALEFGYLSRTGYTGEDGFEFICDRGAAQFAWMELTRAAERIGGFAVGLGARDTLRLEAALPLYGHELSESINPVQTGMRFAFDLKDREFVGKEAICRFEQDDRWPELRGLALEGRRPAREGAKVLHNGIEVGTVTSGTFSPTLQRPIALTYVQRQASAIGTELVVDIRGNEAKATVVELPFYKRRK